jgi:hypothetical protein
VQFARSQVEAHIADDTLDPKAVGRGIADQIALACGISPFAGSRRLAVARALHAELPGVRALTAAGRISVELLDDGLDRHPHTVRTTTPTRHTYTSRAGSAP